MSLFGDCHNKQYCVTNTNWKCKTLGGSSLLIFSLPAFSLLLHICCYFLLHHSSLLHLFHLVSFHIPPLLAYSSSFISLVVVVYCICLSPPSFPLPIYFCIPNPPHFLSNIHLLSFSSFATSLSCFSFYYIIFRCHYFFFAFIP